MVMGCGSSCSDVQEVLPRRQAVHLQGISLRALLRSLLPVAAVIILARRASIPIPCGRTLPTSAFGSLISVQPSTVYRVTKDGSLCCSCRQRDGTFALSSCRERC